LRPERLVLVTGTGTAVGKTWAAAQLAAAWRARGATVAARKPVQSFDPRAGGAGGAGATDAAVLAAATGEDRHDVCPEHRWYPLPMAPPIAAGALGRPSFTVAELVGELRWPPGPPVHYGLVEGAGGPRSPLAADGDTVSLAGLLRPDHIVLVAGAGLGAINAVRLAAAALAPQRPAVLLNRYQGTDPVHVANLEWLRRHTDLAVATDIAELLTRL
jgi:dethiobiotin synthetase